METPLHVLLLEDNPYDARLVVNVLREAGLDVQWERVDTEAELRERLSAKFHVILSDYSMPQFNALQALTILQESGLDIPFIIISGSIGEDIAVSALQQGAADYLLKDRLGRLAEAVRRALEKKSLRDRQRNDAAALLATTERLNHVVTSSPAVLFTLAVVNGGFRPVWFSDNVSALLGYSASDALALDWWATHVHPVDRERVHRLVQTKLFATGQMTTECRMLHRDGTFRWIRNEKRLLRDDAGNPVEVVGSWFDIGDLKRSAQYVAAQHAVTRVLALSPSLDDAMHQILQAICETFEWEWGAYWLLDRDAALMRCLQTWHLPNERFTELEAATKALTFDEGHGLPGKVWQSAAAIWMENVPTNQSFLRAEIAGRAGMRNAYAFPVMLDGAVRGVVEFISGSISRPDGEMQRVLSDVGTQIGQFIEKKQAEADRDKHLARLKHVVASSPAVLFSLKIEADQIVGIRWVSDNITQLLGYDVAQTTGADWWMQHIHPADRDPIVESVHRDLLTRGSVAYEYRFRNVKNEYRWIRSEIRLVRDAAGRASDAIGSWSDITERKSLEEQYRQAQKMEAVGKLAGGVAHDFNNLLTIIMGYTELYQGKTHEGDPLRAALDEIHKAGERATTLTRQLLAFSRKQVLVPVVLDLNAILIEMEKMLRRLIGEDVTLTVVTGSDLWPIKADPGQIEQVVMNIVVNARDAMPLGGKLRLETKNALLNGKGPPSDVKPGNYVCLSISDTGCGMTPEVRAQIFEPFFTTKGPTKGTGLGLATVFGIVSQSNGHVEVESEVDRGTTFKIYLPRDVSGSPIATGPRPKEPIRGGTETLLLVEDEPGVRTLASTILRNLGYAVLEAQSPGDALVICEVQTEPIHLMITDVVMPQISGRQLAERLKLSRPDMKVLFVSGYTDDAIVHHGVLDSGLPFLQKPFSSESLARAVRNVLSDHSSALT